jgi:HK97 family phage major capsid protein
MSENLPVHPFTGVRALWVSPTGRAFYPIAGGDPSGDAEPGRIEQLTEQLTTLRAEIDTLDAVEEPTDDQVTRFEAALGEWDTAHAEHTRLVERAQRVEAVRSVALEPANRERVAPNVIVRTDPFDGVEMVRANFDATGRARMGTQDIIDRAHSAFEGARLPSSRGESSSDQLDKLMERIESIPGAAEHALIHGSPAYRSAFQTWMNAQGQPPVYSPEEAEAVRASMSLTGANGGYMLPTLLDPTLIHTGAATKDPIRRIARVVEGTQNVWHGVSVGGVTTYWKGEGSAFTDGTPAFSNPSVTAGFLSAYVTGSFEIFEDSSSQMQLPGLIAEAIEFAEGTAFISGSGTNAPRGIVTAISATAGSTVTATTRGAFTTASGVDVFALVNAVPSRYEDSSTWVANKATFNTVKQMPAGAGATSSIWPNFEAALGNPLLGSPTAQASDMPSTTVSGTVLIVLGDFSQYVVYDRIGTTVEFIANVVDTNGLPTGQRGLVAHKRVGGDVTDLNAFRFLKT